MENKINLRFEKINKQVLLRALPVIIIVLVVQIIVAFSVCKVAESAAYTAAYEEYSRISSQAADTLDGVFLSLDSTTADFTATINENNKTIILNGREDSGTYTYSQDELATVKSNSYTLMALSELCNQAPSDSVYIIAPYDGGLYFLSADNAVELTTDTYGGLIFASSTGRIIWAQGIFSDMLSDNPYLSDYVSAFSEPSEWVGKTTVDGVTYALSCSALGDSGVWLVSFTDYSIQQSNISSMNGQVVAVTAASCAAVVIAFAAVTLLFAANEKGTRHKYRFEVDSYGRITAADKAFKETFPSAVVIPDDIESYDDSMYNAMKLTAADGDKILACTVSKRMNGRTAVFAGELSMAQYGIDNRNVMQDVFAAFSGGGKRTFIGQIYFASVQTYTMMFGKHFGEEIRAILTQKCREKFVYVYAIDSEHVGVLYPENKNIDNIINNLPDLFTFLNQPVRIENNLVNVEVKGGFALCDSAMADMSYDYAMLASEAALKRACEDKDKTPYFVFHESQKKLYAKYLFDFDIEQMLRDDSFEMEYQPQYSLTENKIVGFEALFRLKKSKAINVSTYDIITYAERSGYMILLGDFIFDESMQFAKEVEDMGVTVSLNVSPVQFMQAGFAENFLRLYRKHNIKPGVVCLEITESFLMTNFDMVIKKMEILRENGVEFHLDDFGMRYSSLLYLKNLPISCIKIDMEFIRDMMENKYSHSITSMIIAVTNNLGLYNIAEGVETKEQMDELRAMNCAVIQGWYIGKSMPPEAALDMLYKTNGITPESLTAVSADEPPADELPADEPSAESAASDSEGGKNDIDDKKDNEDNNG